MRSLKVVLMFLFVIGLATLPACKSAHLSGGKLHFDQGRYDRALEQFELAVEEQPENAEAHLWLGRALAELDEPNKADAEFSKALELDAEQKEFVENTRGHYWSDHYNAGLSLANKGYDAQEQGNASEATEAFESAIDEFDRATVYDVKRQKAFLQKGRLFYQLNRKEEAIEIFERVQSQVEGGTDEATQAEINEILVAAYWEMGDRAYQSEDWDSAIHFYEQAIAVAPGEADLKYQLASTCFQKALSVEEAEQKASHFRDAVNHYGAVLDLVSGDEDALYNLTIALWELGDYADAEVRAKEIVDMNPKDGDYHILLGRIYSKLDKKEEFVAEFIIGKALKEGSKDSAGAMRDEIQKYGPGTDILNAIRNDGEPEEVRRFQDSTGQEYLVWFYWSQGKAMAFIDGARKFQAAFKPIAAEGLGQK